MLTMYIIRTSWEHNQRKRKCNKCNRAGGSEPLRRQFLGPKEYLDGLNNTEKSSVYLIQYKNLLKYKLGCSWPFPYVYTQIREYRCLKNVIHQLERNKWLLLSAFQQGFQQKLSRYLSSHRKRPFLKGFFLKPTERV